MTIPVAPRAPAAVSTSLRLSMAVRRSSSWSEIRQPFMPPQTTPSLILRPFSACWSSSAIFGKSRPCGSKASKPLASRKSSFSAMVLPGATLSWHDKRKRAFGEGSGSVSARAVGGAALTIPVSAERVINLRRLRFMILLALDYGGREEKGIVVKATVSHLKIGTAPKSLNAAHQQPAATEKQQLLKRHLDRRIVDAREVNEFAIKVTPEAEAHDDQQRDQNGRPEGAGTCGPEPPEEHPVRHEHPSSKRYRPQRVKIPCEIAGHQNTDREQKPEWDFESCAPHFSSQCNI